MKCRQCKKKIDESDEFTRVKLSYVHDGCMDDFVSGALTKAQEKKKKDMESLKKTAKDMKYTKSTKSTQMIFNQSVRAFWADKNGMCTCVTCGRKRFWKKSGMDAGHYKTVGARNDLRFNRNNVYPQCSDCNVYKDVSGVFEQYVINHLGKEDHDEMIKNRKQVKHDLAKIRKESREVIRDAGLEV